MANDRPGPFAVSATAVGVTGTATFDLDITAAIPMLGLGSLALLAVLVAIVGAGLAGIRRG